MGWFFPAGFFNADIIIIQKKHTAGKDFDLFSWLDPFSGNVWLAMLLTVLFSSTITWLLQKLSGCHEPGKIRMTRKWRETEVGRGGSLQLISC